MPIHVARMDPRVALTSAYVRCHGEGLRQHRVDVVRDGDPVCVLRWDTDSEHIMLEWQSGGVAVDLCLPGEPMVLLAVLLRGMRCQHVTEREHPLACEQDLARRLNRAI
jgi:hypothetical protein